MVNLRKQMRAFSLMCQRYLNSINTAVKEQVGLRWLFFYSWCGRPVFTAAEDVVGQYCHKCWGVVFIPGLHHTMWSAIDLQSPNDVFRPGATWASGLYARLFFAGRDAQLYPGSSVHWSGWRQQQHRSGSTTVVSMNHSIIWKLRHGLLLLYIYFEWLNYFVSFRWTGWSQ